MAELKKPNYYLYIIMRNDLQSLNPGKGMAQAAHAGNAFVHDIEKRVPKTSPVMRAYQQWSKETHQGFGTTIVLGGSLWLINKLSNDLKKIKEDFLSGVVHDPTYPVRDGDVTHLIPLDTCFYIFCAKEGEVKDILTPFLLHP